VRLAADHDFDERILQGLVARLPDLDVIRVRDLGLARALDPRILEWAAAEERILLTHDRSTMPDFAYDRVRLGLRMPGVVGVPRRLPIGRAIEELELVVACSVEREWEGRVVYLPL
jgi:hypothetical protein